jgi:hypothetical protein
VGVGPALLEPNSNIPPAELELVLLDRADIVELGFVVELGDPDPVVELVVGVACLAIISKGVASGNAIQTMAGMGYGV